MDMHTVADVCAEGGDAQGPYPDYHYHSYSASAHGQVTEVHEYGYQSAAAGGLDYTSYAVDQQAYYHSQPTKEEVAVSETGTSNAYTFYASDKHYTTAAGSSKKKKGKDRKKGKCPILDDIQYQSAHPADMPILPGSPYGQESAYGQESTYGQTYGQQSTYGPYSTYGPEASKYASAASTEHHNETAPTVAGYTTYPQPAYTYPQAYPYTTLVLSKHPEVKHGPYSHQHPTAQANDAPSTAPQPFPPFIGPGTIFAIPARHPSRGRQPPRFEYYVGLRLFPSADRHPTGSCYRLTSYGGRGLATSKTKEWKRQGLHRRDLVPLHVTSRGSSFQTAAATVSDDNDNDDNNHHGGGGGGVALFATLRARGCRKLDKNMLVIASREFEVADVLRDTRESGWTEVGALVPESLEMFRALVQRAWKEGRWARVGDRQLDPEPEPEPEPESESEVGGSGDDDATPSEGLGGDAPQFAGGVGDIVGKSAGAIVGVLADITQPAGLFAGELLLVAAAGAVVGAAGALAGAKAAWDGPRRRRI